MARILVLGRNPEDIGVHERMALESDLKEVQFERIDSGSDDEHLWICLQEEHPLVLVHADSQLPFVRKAVEHGFVHIAYGRHMTSEGSDFGIRLLKLLPDGTFEPVLIRELSGRP